MSKTENKVYILIALEGVSKKICEYVDAGYFTEAQDLDSKIWALKDKVKSLISQHGGQYLLSTYERHVLHLPITVAEELPLILKGYKDTFSDRMAVGIGLTMSEAVRACEKSYFTGDIEMFDPEDKSYEEVKKNIEISDDIFDVTQPNLFDRQHPKSPTPDASKDKIGKYVIAPNAQQSLQLEQQMIMATMQQLNAPAEQAQQQMQQQMQQQQQEMQQQNPQNLLEALSGERQQGQQQQQAKPQQEEQQAEESESKIGQEEVESSQDESKEAEKLAGLLEMVNEKIPKLTDLADKNPEAFKKVLGLVHKIVDMAKDKKKDLDKKEVKDLTEELNKTIKMFYPVGTVKNGKKKVIKDGKASWRSVRAGMVKDSAGNAISVASHNAKADDGSSGVK